MPVIAPAPLQTFVINILEGAGAQTELASICASHLVNANLKGHDSHGVGMIPAYIAAIRAGFTDPNQHIEVLKDSGALITIDGQRGLGQVVAQEAIDFALARVPTTGLVGMALRNASHIGRIGTYAERCADAGYVSVHFVNVLGRGPLVVPWGGREPRMITNPFTCAVPRPDGNHIVLDMATSTVAAGKVRVAAMKKVPMAPGVLMAHDGRPTTDAGSMFKEPRSSLTAFGEHKGSGMMLMCELLAGALAGNQTMQPARERLEHTVNNMLSFVIDPKAVPGGAHVFGTEVEAMIDWVRATPTAEGFDEVLVPGDPERASRARRLADGIDIDDNSWSAINDAAAAVGVARQDG